MPHLTRHAAWYDEARSLNVPLAAVHEALAELDRLPSPREWAAAEVEVRRLGWMAVGVLRGRSVEETPGMFRRIEQAGDAHARLEACADLVGLDEAERSAVIARAARRLDGRNRAGLAVEAALARLHGVPAEPCDAWTARFDAISSLAAEKFLTDRDKVTVVWGDVYVQAHNGVWRGLELPDTGPEADFWTRYRHAKVHPRSLTTGPAMTVPDGPAEKIVVEPRRPWASEAVQPGTEDTLVTSTPLHDQAARTMINQVLDNYGWAEQSPLIPWDTLGGGERRLTAYIEGARCWLWHGEILAKPEGDPAHKDDPSHGDSVSTRADIARRALRWVDPWTDGNVQRRVTHAPPVAFALWSAAGIATDHADRSQQTVLADACRAWQAEAARAGRELFPALQDRLTRNGAPQGRFEAIHAVIDAMTNTLRPEKGQENH